MSTDKKYLVGLSFFEGIGPQRYRLLKNYFKSAENIFKASEKDLLSTGLGKELVKRFCLFRESFDLDSFILSFHKKNIQVVTEEDKIYPKLLQEIGGTPFILYALGDVSLLSDMFCIGVVGTRKPTSYGIQVTKDITYGLVNGGSTVVSGMAMGVDAVAHKTTLELSGRTIAVLGCGVDICYPAINRSLYNELQKKGLIISEFPPGTRTSKGVFPSRNRIIAGLSRGVVVTEGTEDSGSLITAKCASEYGRDVFAVPGPITSAQSAAPTLLLRNGAKLVTSATDILEEYNVQAILPKSRNEIERNLTTAEKSVVLAIEEKGNLHIDEIIRTVQVAPSEIFSLISTLELKGIITESGQGIYQLVQ